MDKEKMDKEFSEITKKHEESFQIEYQEYLRLRKYLFTPLGFAKPVFPNYHPQPYRPIDPHAAALIFLAENYGTKK